jgi:hypothetical protein
MPILNIMVLKEHIEPSRTFDKRKAMWMTTLSNLGISCQKQNRDKINMALLLHSRKD